MINILDEYLPQEITNMIFKKLKDDFNRQLKYILENETVWIITNGKLSFLILERNIQKNPYYLLEYESNNNFIINKKKIDKKRA